MSEWQLRTPMVDSGTNLLGILKHCANVEAGYTPTEQPAHLARLREIAESYRTGRLNA